MSTKSFFRELIYYEISGFYPLENISKAGIISTYETTGITKT